MKEKTTLTHTQQKENECLCYRGFLVSTTNAQRESVREHAIVIVKSAVVLPTHRYSSSPPHIPHITPLIVAR